MFEFIILCFHKRNCYALSAVRFVTNISCRKVPIIEEIRTAKTSN